MSDLKPPILEATDEEVIPIGETPEIELPIEDKLVPEELNILPLRDSVIFPMLIAPLSVSRTAAVQLIDDSVISSQRTIGIVAQLDADVDEPKGIDIHHVGCAVIIRTLMKGPDAVRLIVQGIQRFRILEILQTEPYIKARVEEIREPEDIPGDEEEVEALRRSVAALFDQAVRLSPSMPDELRTMTQTVQEPNVLADLVAAHMSFSVLDKQAVLETIALRPRLLKLLELLGKEVRVLELSSKVHNEVSAELSKSQRDYYLRGQIKAIQRELGELGDPDAELDDLNDKIGAAEMPDEAMAATMKELERLRRINPSSPEYTVARTYVETMASLPWNKQSTDNLDLAHARTILDDEHYGLQKIKERILEFLAVRKVKKGGSIRQPIICFYGPPGVGKTSLGRSIATAMGRKFYRLSVGGVRDEAEIRGHRRTYIGSLPGQIIQGIRRSETNNPVFVLDEVDKLGQDYKGDPSSALLEVLDPQQNSTFRDHYLDVPFDLSQVFFITTANRLDTIPAPLRDRMEIIEIGSYTEEEKLKIAEQHLVPRQVSEHGLTPKQIVFQESALQLLIRGYTREAGVRNLDREIGAIVRKVTLQYAEGRTRRLTITPKVMQGLIGSPRFMHDEVAERKMIPGVAVGLAWTPVGGDVLFIETSRSPGSKGLVVTGRLGDVMKESITAALSYIRAHSKVLHIPADFYEKTEIHVHVPAGAVPKDGPSAGVTMITALVSLLTGRTVKERLAMTGEITLTGQVLPVGGIKEKVLAAYRAGVQTLVLPADNKKDYVEDVPEDIRVKLTTHFVSDVTHVLKLALEKA